MLGINNKYIENVKQTLQLLDKYDIRVAIHSILTQRNSTKEDFISIFHFIKSLSNILYWKPDIGGESIYVNSAIQGTIAPTKEAQASISALCKNYRIRLTFQSYLQVLIKKIQTLPLRLGLSLMKEVFALVIISNYLFCQMEMLLFVKNYTGILNLLWVIF